MSHFSVLVVSQEEPTEEYLDRVLAPFHEFECTGIDDQYVEDVDITQEARELFASQMKKMLKAPDGSLVSAYDDQFYRDPTPDENKELKKFAGSFGTIGKTSYKAEDWNDGLGYRYKVRFVPDGYQEMETPAAETQTFAQWASDYYGKKFVTQEQDIYASRAEGGRVLDSYKYGYIIGSLEDGHVIKIVERTNKSAKWDWWQIGGRYTGMFKPQYDPGRDPENQETCSLCKGTGKRDDELGRDRRREDPSFSCNSCGGTGKSQKWPTEWKNIGNVIQLKDLPLVTLRDQAEREILTFYDKAHAIIAGRQIPRWEDVLEAGPDIETARTNWRQHPVVTDLTKAKLLSGWNDDAVLADLSRSRVQVATSARQRAIMTFAVLKDGKWYDRGDMGWWGIVTNEKDTDVWEREFSALLDDLPPETWLAVVDCHI